MNATATDRVEPSTFVQSDADDVRALYARLMDGWNRESAEAFAAPFAEECDFIAFDVCASADEMSSSAFTARCSRHT